MNIQRTHFSSLQAQPLKQKQHQQQPVKFSGMMDDLADNPGQLKKYARRIGFGIFGLFAMIGVLSNAGISNNPNGTISVVHKKYASQGFRMNADGTCKVEHPGWVPRFLEENYNFPSHLLTVRDTFQPYTAEGVKIDGTNGEKVNGQDQQFDSHQGIDTRISFSLDPMEVPKVDAEGKPVMGADGKPEMVKTYSGACDLLNHVVGVSDLNEKYAESHPATEFADNSQDESVKIIYYTKIMPMLQEAMNLVASRFQTKDIQEKRAEFENILINGLTEELTDANGTKHSVVLLEPIAKRLKDIDLVLDKLELSTFDMPSFLAAKNREASDLNIRKTNDMAQARQFEAEALTAREKVKADFGPQIQNSRGQVSSAVAEQQGLLSSARERRESEKANATGYEKQVLAQANGYLAIKTAEANTGAVGVRRDADIHAAQKGAQAAGGAAGILEEAKADATAKTDLGGQLTDELVEKARIEARQEVLEALAKIIGPSLLKPGADGNQILESLLPTVLRTPVKK